VIARVWRGRTTAADADDYETFVTEDLFAAAEGSIDGLVDSELLRREVEGGVEFVTILRFESMTAVEEFAGEAPERAHVPDSAKELLAEYDDTADHFDVRA
jgi:heme-degrading monooxygenase HmoA